MRTVTISILTLGLVVSIIHGSVFFIITCVLLIILAIHNITQTKHGLLINYPILGILRWVVEGYLRDKIRQYFNESDTDKVPFSKEQRSIAYRRAKNAVDSLAFGSLHNMYAVGYEFIKHTMFFNKIEEERFTIGTKHCKRPYSASIINISAMSFGSLSNAAILALNKGAYKGGFMHNTGEGGISKYHLEGKGDLAFQLGTGYFGCGYTDDNGVRRFDKNMFRVNAKLPNVKVIEIKISQGAKPAHGGQLPAKKNTEEIANIRGIEPFTTVNSPASHSAFTNFDELVDFIALLRDNCDGKPVGIKLCVGDEHELDEMIRTFKVRDNYPDFITVDGSEGGTGSAPPEHTNNVGMPLLDGLVMLRGKMKKWGLNENIKIIASGKIIDSFDVVRAIALGANGVNIARGFMFSMGCIQARICHRDRCPVGITTQKKHLIRGLVVEDKYQRVYNFHKNTIKAVKHLIGGMPNVENIKDITADKVFRRVEGGEIKSLKEIYSL